jgi:hypothetical protein
MRLLPSPPPPLSLSVYHLTNVYIHHPSTRLNKAKKRGRERKEKEQHSRFRQMTSEQSVDVSRQQFEPFTRTMSSFLNDNRPMLHDTSSSSCSISSTSSSPTRSIPDHRSSSIRKTRTFTPDERKDPMYWSRRSRNNLSATRCRVKRRVNDLVLETKVTQLNEENQILRAKIDMLTRKCVQLTHPEHPTTEPTPCVSSSTATECSLRDQCPLPIKWRLKHQPMLD